MVGEFNLGSGWIAGQMTKNSLTYHVISSWKNMTVYLWTVTAASLLEGWNWLDQS